MEIYQSSACARQLKKLPDSFRNALYDNLEQHPPAPHEILTEINDFKAVKRRIADPNRKKGKSNSFRVLYWTNDAQILICTLIDVSSKEKDKRRAKYLAEMKDILNKFIEQQ